MMDTALFISTSSAKSTPLLDNTREMYPSSLDWRLGAVAARINTSQKTKKYKGSAMKLTGAKNDSCKGKIIKIVNLIHFHIYFKILYDFTICFYDPSLFCIFHAVSKS